MWPGKFSVVVFNTCSHSQVLRTILVNSLSELVNPDHLRWMASSRVQWKIKTFDRNSRLLDWCVLIRWIWNIRYPYSCLTNRTDKKVLMFILQLSFKGESTIWKCSRFANLEPSYGVTERVRKGQLLFISKLLLKPANRQLEIPNSQCEVRAEPIKIRPDATKSN